jgi:hypothetical protein
MHRARTTALAAALWLILTHVPALLAFPQASGLTEKARQRLASHDPAGAVTLLEEALPGVTADDRPIVVALLREAYAAAAREADAEGRHDEAEAYRDNLSILERKPRASSTDAKAIPRPAATIEVPIAAPARPKTPPPPASNDRPRSDPGVTLASAEPPEPPSQKFVPPLTAPLESPAVVAPLPQPGQAERPGSIRPAVAGPGESPVDLPLDNAATHTPGTNSGDKGPAVSGEVSVAAADAAFVKKRYDEAGRIYASLDRMKALPADRRDHWAYCRAADVVDRINARPSSSQEWASIDAEIAKIRALSPTNWFGEYLQKVAAVRNPGGRKGRARRLDKMVVRASSPDDAPAPAPAPAPAAAPPPRPAHAPVAPARPTAPVTGGPISWAKQPVVSESFQVAYPEGQRALAEQVARAAETARASSLKRWGETTPGQPWSPRCELVLFPTAADFSRETGQPADSPGFSTMGMNAGKIIFRRINLRIDHPNLVKAILPHEVTHVVLADLFPHKQIPRWADEGMAVLSEPSVEQNIRAGDLEEPLNTGRLFKLSDLMVMDYPDARFWSLYYAQSVSVTRFLVEQGTPAQFVKFVQEAQRSGVEPAMKQVYKIKDYPELQSRWLTYARAKASAELTASSTDPEKAPGTARR